MKVIHAALALVLLGFPVDFGLYPRAVPIILEKPLGRPRKSSKSPGKSKKSPGKSPKSSGKSKKLPGKSPKSPKMPSDPLKTQSVPMKKSKKVIRNTNGCEQHKKGHQKCPLDCPRRGQSRS